MWTIKEMIEWVLPLTPLLWVAAIISPLFYLVTEWIQGNNSWHVPLGYNNLAEGNRFISKADENAYYEPGDNRGVSNIVLGDSTFERNANFAIPLGVSFALKSWACYF